MFNRLKSKFRVSGLWFSRAEGSYRLRLLRAGFRAGSDFDLG